MIIEPSNYTYETMPDYTDAVDGAVEIPVTGEEIEIRYAHEVVYDEAHNLHLEIFTPFQMAHPELKREIILAEDVDIRALSTEVAGGFVGCTAGIYAVAEGEEADGYAMFKSLSYEEREGK